MTSMPGGSQDPEQQAKLWRAVVERYKIRSSRNLDRPQAIDNVASATQASQSLAPTVPSMPGAVHDPEEVKLWEAIGEQYRTRPSFTPTTSSTPSGVHDPEEAKLWKAIGDQYRRRSHSSGQAPGFDAPPHLIIHSHPPVAEWLVVGNGTNISQLPYPLTPDMPSTPSGVDDPEQVKLWKAIEDHYRRRSHPGGNPGQPSSGQGRNE